jgi:hypothetical protein
MSRIARPLAGAAVIVLVIAGALFALGRAMGVGPFALGVPTTWIYTAISRSGEEGDAREIEVIDLASGDRQLFSVDDRAFEIALSRDRRTLYAGSTNGRIWALDALRGAFLAEIKLSGSGEVRRIVVDPDGRRLVALSTSATESTAAVVDLVTRRELSSVTLGNRLVGRSAAGADVIVPVTERAGLETILVLSLDPLRVRQEVSRYQDSIRQSGTRTAASSLVLASDGSAVAVSPFGLRLTAFTAGLGEWRNAIIPFGTGASPLLPPGFDGDLILTRNESVIHFCVGTGQRAERYLAERATLTVQRVGTECGRFARLGDGRLFLAVRAKPELRELDPASGAVKRTLELAGYPSRVAY